MIENSFLIENYPKLALYFAAPIDRVLLLESRHCYYYHKLSYKANSESRYCNLRFCDIGVKTNFSSYDLFTLMQIMLSPYLLRQRVLITEVPECNKN